MLHTTLGLLRQAHACVDRYKVLLNHLGRKYGDDTTISLMRILEENGFEDALWALKSVVSGEEEQRDRVSRRIACRFKRETPLLDGRFVWDFLLDPRSQKVIEVAERYADGDGTDEELSAAGAAVEAAAWAMQTKIFTEELAGRVPPTDGDRKSARTMNTLSSLPRGD